MYRKWQKGEITTFVVLGVLTLIGVATFLNTSLNQKSKPIGTRAQTPSCPYNSNQTVPLGSTEQNQANMENRWPISSNRHEYDFYSYFVPATIPEAQRDGKPVLTQSLYLNFQDAPPGATDSKVTGMLGTMFGYKPNQLADAYFMKYKDAALQGADTAVKGDAPAIRVPISPGDPVKMPDTQYDIGGGKEGLVVFAAADRITVHISRSEYIKGTVGQQSCLTDPANPNSAKKDCRGGYWIYIRGICVDQQIVDAYNRAQTGAKNQQNAGADKSPINLPEIAPSQILGLASGNSVEVIVRDDGPLISIHKPFYWQGAPAKDFGNLPTAVPPTVTPGGATATPTPPSGATCGYQGLRCCNPSDPVPAGTSCFNSLTCTSNICQPPSPPGSLCGYQGLRCCNPSDVGIPPGTSCFLGLTCNASTTTCGQVGAPTATPTSTVSGPRPSWTPTPTPNAPTPIRSTCKSLEINGDVRKKYDLVFLPSGYNDYGSFETDSYKAISALKDTNLGTVLKKFNFKLHTDINKSYNLNHCNIINPTSGSKGPCWDKNIASISSQQCQGDGYVIIHYTKKFTENADEAVRSLESFGYILGVTSDPGNVAIFRFTFDAAPILYGFESTVAHELSHSIAQAHDEYVTDKVAPATYVAPLNCSPDPSIDNLETTTCPKWKVDFPTSGCYTGCYYSNWYRPEKYSIMGDDFDDDTQRVIKTFDAQTLKLWQDAMSGFL